MLINMQQLKDLHLKKFYLADPDRTLLGVLPDPAEKHGTFRLTPYSEITFSLERTAENAAMYDGLTKLQKILVEDIGWFILEEPDVSSDGRTETKRCTMYSEEYELTGRMLRHFYLNTNDPGSIGSAKDGFVTFCDASLPERPPPGPGKISGLDRRLYPSASGKPEGHRRILRGRAGRLQLPHRGPCQSRLLPLPL